MNTTDRLKAWFELARISNSPTVISNVMAGAAMASVMPLGEAHRGTILLLSISMLMFYTAGMFLNDIFDLAIDKKERPERPLVQGRIRRSTAITATLLLFAGGLLLLARVGFMPFWSGCVLVALIALYNFRHKGNPLAPFVMALTRVMVYVIAFFAFSTELPNYDLTGYLFSTGLMTKELIVILLLSFLYVSGLTYIASGENRTDMLRYWPVIMIVPAPVYFLFRVEGTGLAIALLFLFWLFWSLHYAWRVKNRQIGGAIVRLIAGISIFDAVILASFGLYGTALIALLLFVFTRYFQHYIQGS